MEQAIQGAVLFADVSGSTQLYESRGDEAASKAVAECVELFKQKTLASGGRVVKTMGDEVMSAFPDANAAADAAIEIQLGVNALEQVAGTKLGVRIGFHFGPLVERDQDLFGDTVNLAARLVDQATKDQIITSRATADLLNPVLKGCCRTLYSISVKGKSSEVEICEVVWRQSDDLTGIAPSLSTSSKRRTLLRLIYRDQEIVLDERRRDLTMGRDKSAELVIDDRMASRLHGKIEQRTDKFVLVDHSANGTYVALEGGSEIVLRREEMVLHGHGWISLGQSRSATVEILEFFCE